MNRPGWNAGRRNRNAGTSKSGRGADNRLAIPDPRNDDRMFWGRLRSAVPVEAGGLCIWLEPCGPGFVHAATVADIVHMMALLPAEDISGLRNIVLRQPTRKQRLLSQVWGRFVYQARLGKHEGPAIILEAHPTGESFQRSRSERPEDAEETERLRADGHHVATQRCVVIATTIDSVRTTQLFRTIPHEVGHYVHYQREVVGPAGNDVDRWLLLWDRYFARPAREREDFAHRYARDAAERLSARGEVPFERLADGSVMRRQALDPIWFGVSDSEHGTVAHDVLPLR
jgi:hypothetical protein